MQRFHVHFDLTPHPDLSVDWEKADIKGTLTLNAESAEIARETARHLVKSGANFCCLEVEEAC